MYKLYKYPILVGGDGYTVSVEKPPIVLGSPVYTRYVEQPIYFGSLINTNNTNTCTSNFNNQTGGAELAAIQRNTPPPPPPPVNTNLITAELNSKLESVLRKLSRIEEKLIRLDDIDYNLLIVKGQVLPPYHEDDGSVLVRT